MTTHDVLVIGAGIAGLYAVHRLRGRGLEVLCVEAADGVGGTWYWNRYPGARCDVESVDYSYSFDPELEQGWDWSERYATQPEILRYLEHVADRHDLRRSIRFGTTVTAARFENGRWVVETDGDGPLEARFLVCATGSLSVPRTPELPGLDRFTGRVLHTARWPHDGVDLTGRRVGLIGTGSSGIQATPLLAERAAHLTVFQRSATYTVPAGNGPHTPESRAAYRADYPERRRLSRDSGGGSPHQAHPCGTLEVSDAERHAAYQRRWELGGVLFSKTFPDQMITEEANAPARAFWEQKVRAVVTDPRTAERLIPTDHPIGTKRICTDSGFHAAFNRPDVALVDLRADPITELVPDGVRTSSGLHPLDDLVFATGFDAMTGALAAIDVRGRDGRPLAEAWAAGPHTYLGLSVAGFPNMFVVNGPGSPSVLANMVLTAEHQVDWITDAITHVDAAGLSSIEAQEPAQSRWTRHCAELADGTLFPRADSWYLGANVPGKPRVFMPYIGGFGRYRGEVAEVVAQGYRGFDLI